MTTLVAVQPKSMFASRSFWLNAVTALLGVLLTLQEVVPALAEIFPIPPVVIATIATLIAVANIVLRRLSDQPARFTKEGVEDGVALQKAQMAWGSDA